MHIVFGIRSMLLAAFYHATLTLKPGLIIQIRDFHVRDAGGVNLLIYGPGFHFAFLSTGAVVGGCLRDLSQQRI